jgi:excisionase family DNA binding protein
MNTKEVARYLDIHEKQVYGLIKSGRIPATRITGKWIFPKTLIDEWIETNAKQGVKEARQKSRQIEGGLLASGSNDIILDMLQTYVKKRHPDFYIFSANTGSTEGLKALNEVLKSRDFRKRVERLGGYDFKDSGKVLYSTT